VHTTRELAGEGWSKKKAKHKGMITNAARERRRANGTESANALRGDQVLKK